MPRRADRDDSLRALKNLGPRSVEWLLEAGIADVATLRRLGPVRSYLRVKALRPGSANRNLLWALAGALLDCPFTELPPELREQLERELEERTE